MTRAEIKQIMFLIANEYNDFMPKQKEMQTLKVNTWFESLKEYEFQLAQQATIQLLKTFEYGTPKLSHICSILNPKLETQNLGQEFADRLIALLYSKGAEGMGDSILDEYGEIGYQIWLDNKIYMREMLKNEIPTLKAQMRNRYNSMQERKEKEGYIALPFKENKIIMGKLANMKMLGEEKNGEPNKKL